MIFHKKYLIVGFLLSIFMLLNFSEALGKAFQKENSPTAKKTVLKKVKNISSGASHKKKAVSSSKETQKHSASSLSWKSFTPATPDRKGRSKSLHASKSSVRTPSLQGNNMIPKGISLSLPVQKSSHASTSIKKRDISEDNLSLEPITFRSPPTGEYAAARLVKDPATLVVFYRGKEQEVKLIGIKKPLTSNGNGNGNNKALDKPNPDSVDKGASVQEQPEDKATGYARKMIEKRMIRMKFDDKGPMRDNEGRLRVYVHRENGYFLNGDLVKQGLVQVDQESDYALKDEFKKMEKEVKEQGKGNWK